MLVPAFLLLLALIPPLAASSLQTPALLPGGVHDANALYPCQPSTLVVRFFHLENDAPELAKVRAALEELGAEIAYGPRTTSGRPGHSFFALRAPREASPKALTAALRKGGGQAEMLAVVAFDGRQGEPHDFGLAGMGVTERDFAMGISGDVVWYDAFGPWSQFYGRPGKLEAQELADRYAKLYAPYGGARLGEVVKERFQWNLTVAPDEKQRVKVLRMLEKQRCVESASIEGAVLTVTVKLIGLEACASVGKVPHASQALDEASQESPRAAYDTGPLYAALLGEGLVP